MKNQGKVPGGRESVTDAQGGVVSVAGAPWEIKTEKIEWKAGSRRDIGRGLSPMQWQETASRGVTASNLCPE